MGLRTRALAIVFVLAPHLAAATSISTDVTDLWWNPAESGWGVNLIQQDNIVFATLFVYDASSQPTWFVGSALATSGPDTSGRVTFTGPWYRTSGNPWYLGVFDPSVVE